MILSCVTIYGLMVRSWTHERKVMGSSPTLPWHETKLIFLHEKIMLLNMNSIRRIEFMFKSVIFSSKNVSFLHVMVRWDLNPWPNVAWVEFLTIKPYIVIQRIFSFSTTLASLRTLSKEPQGIISNQIGSTLDLSLLAFIVYSSHIIYRCHHHSHLVPLSLSLSLSLLFSSVLHLLFFLVLIFLS